jgi:pyrroline-5-carboxylate reductase
LIRRALGITVVTDNRAAVARSNMVLLCVRPQQITEAGIRFLDKARVDDILNAMVVHCLARIGSIRGQFTSASVVK